MLRPYRRIIKQPSEYSNYTRLTQSCSPNRNELMIEARSAFCVQDIKTNVLKRYKDAKTGETIGMECRETTNIMKNKELTLLDRIRGEIGCRRGLCTKYTDDIGTIYVWKKK